MKFTTCVIRCGVLLLSLLPAVLIQAQEWTRFRGPNGTGISELKGVPTTWSLNDYEWIVDLPGKGHSSPVIWGESLFLTTSQEDGSRTLVCLNAETGKILWTDTIPLGANHLHKKSSYASGTPAVDGKRVYVGFADDEHYTVLAYSHAGERIWTRDLGSFSSQHGQGVSPMVHGDLLIVPNDQRGPSQIVALSVDTGDEVWSTRDRRSGAASYATPMILNIDGNDRLICLSGTHGLSAHDLATGEEVWASGELPQRTVGSPTFGAGLLFATCGSGGIGKYMVAVDPHGKGDVSESHIKGVRTQNLPYVPTPVVHEDHLYLWNDNGIVCCVDLKGDLTENVWRQRIGGNFSGSPVLIDGKLYCMSEDGEVVVMDASPTYHLHGKSPLPEASYSTPAVANGRVYFRTFTKLASLKADPKKVSLSD